MPLTSDQPSSSTSYKGKGGKILSHGRHPSTGRPVDGNSSQPMFPRIEDCAHFHYETVNYGRIKVAFIEESSDGLRLNGALNIEGFNPAFNVRITCKENTWVVKRNLSHFCTLDEWLHECVYDRKFSHLPVLNSTELISQTLDDIQTKLRSYLRKFSSLTDFENGEAQIFCAPVLHWLEIDNHGRNLVPHAFGDVVDINIPAIAAARVVRRYQARDDDELTLDVGDMVSIIEMGVSGWWRGKQGKQLKVGSFPSQCVRRINSATDVVGTHERTFSSPSYTVQNQEKPIVRKHGKFMEFLRSFLDTRPSKAHLKKKGILKERVFGCDLGELLHRTGEDIPAVVSDCTAFVEKYGIVDGIYRISGGSSHIRHLKYEFDSDGRPDLEDHLINVPNVSDIPGMAKERTLRCDAHSVAGLCKLYFRELPNPLLTYQLYNRFASAVTDYEAEDRLLKVHDVVQQLPPPHYRTLKHLITHLRFMSRQEDRTSMHCRNLAIVWAPNLLRSREIEAGLAAFTEARVQSVVTEFLILNGDLLFSEKLQTIQYDADHKPPRPRSLMFLPTPKLISLEEAQARSKSGVVTPASQTGSPVDVSISGVRLRHPPEKSTANEKRKRSKKTATSACTPNSPYPPRSSKKQGHRHAASCSETFTLSAELKDSPVTVTPSKSSAVSGWKVKLGSLLRKSQASKQGSLRRSQSYDSLRIIRDSLPKLSDDASEFSSLKTTLSRAKSCEDTGCSDRSHPEPQVPHSSRVPLPPLNTNFRRMEPLKPPDDEKPKSETVARCSSPFCALDTDLPSVMDENGLDFDPLSYRLANIQSPVRKGAHAQKTNQRFFGESSKSHSESSATGTGCAMKDGRKTDSTRTGAFDIHKAAKSFSNSAGNFTPTAAAKDKFPPKEVHSHLPHGTKSLSSDHPSSSTNPIPSSIPISDFQSIANVQIETNVSAKNNSPSDDLNSCRLDDLTADSFAQSPFTPVSKSARVTAAERLGLKKGKSGFPKKVLKKSPPDHEGDKKWKIQQRVEVPAPPTENPSEKLAAQPQKSEMANRKISVQVYNLPNNCHLQRDDHYGSFIALVGSAVETNQPNIQIPRNQPSSAARKTNPSQCQSSSNPNEFGHGNSNPVSSYAGTETGTAFVSTKSKPFWYEPKVLNARVCHSKLETFSPAGKCRQNYPDLETISPAYVINPFPLYDAQRKPSRSSYEARYENCVVSDPKLPLPGSQYLRHGRSYSVGDYTAARVEKKHPQPSYHPREQYHGVRYENRTYEDFYHFHQNSQKSTVETLQDCTYMDPSLALSGRTRSSSQGHPYSPFPQDRSSDHSVQIETGRLPINVPISGQFHRRNSSGTAFSNPSYELRPMYYKSTKRYDLPPNRRPSTLFASVQENTTSLSWV